MLRRIYVTLLVFVLGGILACLLLVGKFWMENKRTESILESLRDYRSISTSTGEEFKIESNKDGSLLSTDIEDANTVPLITKADIDFAKLKSENSETIGWLYIEGVDIDHPVVLKAGDNKHYLTHDFYNKKSSAGWVYVDGACNADMTSKNTIVYGHNRYDGTMFGKLLLMNKRSYLDNGGSKYVYFYTPSGVLVYEIFSVYTTHMDFLFDQKFFSSGELNDFVYTVKRKNELVGLDKTITCSDYDKILTIVTCEGTDKRLVVHGKLIEYTNNISS